MQTLTKQNIKRDISPVAIGQGWELFLPGASEEPELNDLTEARSALEQAEIVIRAQEERIQLLQQLTVTDELTSLANRRGFAIAFDRELALARRDADYKGVLVMIDLDGFKVINDQFGHQTGDIYLCAVAQALKENVRSTDTVARLGGDEFALLLTNVDEKNGLKRLAKIEQSFAKKSINVGEEISLKASFGLAPYSSGLSVETVMQSADLRLYAHKARNRKLTA